MQESSYLHQTGHVKNIKEGEEYNLSSESICNQKLKGRRKQKNCC